MKTRIEKIDNLGRGICYVDGKITFVAKVVPGDIVDITLTIQKSKYNEAILNKVIEFSSKRKESICPYFRVCGGCDFLNLTYEDTKDYKQNKMLDLFKRNKLEYKHFTFVENENKYNYRNKVSLKVVDGKIGFYEAMTHNLVEITKCYLVKEKINEVIKYLPFLKIKNGSITIRCNYLDELLIIINTKDNINANEFIKVYSVKGIILNNKCIYGDDYFIEEINNIKYKVSYNSFFQVNPYIASKLLEIIKENVFGNVLDLYCGVGFLSLGSCNTSNNVIGLEIIENAVKNAKENAKLNNISNVEFICKDLAEGLNLNKKIDTLIVDPPRAGIDKKTMDYIVNLAPQKIIYTSCDPITLMRDLLILKDKYDISNVYALDMFSFTYHTECVCVMEKK